MSLGAKATGRRAVGGVLAEEQRPWFDERSGGVARHLTAGAAGAAFLAIDEVMTVWAGDPSLPDPVGLLHQALQVLDGPALFPKKSRSRASTGRSYGSQDVSW